MSSSIFCTLASASQELDHRRVAAGERAQLRVVVRIGQAAHVEHQVGVERNAVLEAERLEQQRQPGVGRARRSPCIQRAQRVRA